MRIETHDKGIMSILLDIANDRSTSRSSRRADHAELALLRLLEGNYGTCVDCKKTIPEARLIEIPEAMRCVECQSVRDCTRAWQ